jgi:MFS family permease
MSSPEPVTPAIPALPKAVLKKVSRRYVVLLVLASVGVWMAFVAPMAYSLAIRIQQLAPGQAQYLGYITGAGGVVSLVLNPSVGVLSDRTRSRLGRRCPYLVVGGLIGVAALLILALAPSLLVLGLGWMLAVIGWQTAMAAVNTLLADKLPESQRGKVAGLTGLAQMAAPVLGVGVATTLVGNNVLLLLVPGLIGLVLLTPLALWPQDRDSRAMALPAERISPAKVVAKFKFFAAAPRFRLAQAVEPGWATRR